MIQGNHEGIRVREARERGAGLKPEPEELAIGSACAAPDLLDSVGLGIRQTRSVGRRAGLAALQNMRVEVAFARIVDDPVNDPIERVAGLHGRSVNCIQFALGDGRSHVEFHYHLRPEFRRNESVPVEGRGAGEDSVVVFLEALRLHPSLATAC